jgi:DNA-directed RNA polymerase subunit K/omega
LNININYRYKNKNITMNNTNNLTKYEKVRVIGTRATQISMGAQPFIPLDGMTDALEIATRELEMGKLPLVVVRHYPDGHSENIHVTQCIPQTK